MRPVAIGAIVNIEDGQSVIRAVNAKTFAERVKLQMGEGLRATLKTGNLLTGALFVDINFYEAKSLTNQENLMVIQYSRLWLVA
ncbi:hypothetical protein L4D11_03290 [Vibrio gigantis]|uniref:hypothetical protein n=1 Tax=Vibrio gigantis TaxID=296199 RepID=UPI003D096D93